MSMSQWGKPILLAGNGGTIIVRCYDNVVQVGLGEQLVEEGSGVRAASALQEAGVG